MLGVTTKANYAIEDEIVGILNEEDNSVSVDPLKGENIKMVDGLKKEEETEPIIEAVRSFLILEELLMVEKRKLFAEGQLQSFLFSN